MRVGFTVLARAGLGAALAPGLVVAPAVAVTPSTAAAPAPAIVVAPPLPACTCADVPTPLAACGDWASTLLDTRLGLPRTGRRRTARTGAGCRIRDRLPPVLDPAVVERSPFPRVVHVLPTAASVGSAPGIRARARVYCTGLRADLVRGSPTH